MSSIVQQNIYAHQFSAVSSMPQVLHTVSMNICIVYGLESHYHLKM